MNTLVWSKEMSVGSVELDNQHQTLFALYNNLLVVLASGVANRVFGLSDGVLQGLVEYINLHFGYEESLIEKAGYPDLAAHKAQHGIYVNKISEARARLDRNSDPEAWEELCHFLSDWLVGHVMGTDRLYAPYLQALR